MASTVPVVGETYTFGVSVESQATPGTFQAAATIAAGDFQRSINGAAFANLTNLPTVTPAAGRRIQIVLAAAETTAAGAGGEIYVVGHDAAGGEWYDVAVSLRVFADDLPTDVDTDAIKADTAAILLDTGTDGVVIADGGITAAKVAASGANRIADHTIRRTFQNACDSADGDAKNFRSLLGAIGKLVNRIVSSAGTLTVYEDDDATALGTQTVTTDATADPITELNTT